MTCSLCGHIERAVIINYLTLRGKFTPVHPLTLSDAPCSKMKATLHRETGKGMHHIHPKVFICDK